MLLFQAQAQAQAQSQSLVFELDLAPKYDKYATKMANIEESMEVTFLLCDGSLGA